MKTFSPDKQIVYCRDSVRCFSGSAPSLTNVSNAYGRIVAEMWISAQIRDFVEYSSVRIKPTTVQIGEMACVVAVEYGFLKVTEVMLFFFRYKSGRYGKFYGVVDPLVMVDALRVFIGERVAELTKIDDQRAKDKKASDDRLRAEMDRRGELMSYDEYKEIAWLFRM